MLTMDTLIASVQAEHRSTLKVDRRKPTHRQRPDTSLISEALLRPPPQSGTLRRNDNLAE